MKAKLMQSLRKMREKLLFSPFAHFNRFKTRKLAAQSHSPILSLSLSLFRTKKFKLFLQMQHNIVVEFKLKCFSDSP
jgi:hypothetical protein